MFGDELVDLLLQKHIGLFFLFVFGKFHSQQVEDSFDMIELARFDLVQHVSRMFVD